jgi:hypothetical protein
MLADWASIKSLLTGRNISAQYVTVGSNYWIKAKDGIFELECLLPTNTSLSTDSADFVANFLPSANIAPRSNVVQVLGADSLTLCPFGAYSGSTLVANAVTPWDIVLPESMVLRGAVLFSPDGILGDWISVQVVDKDNVTGQGGTPSNPTILGTYAISYYLAPGIPNKVEDVSISESLPAGVYMRVNYTSTGTVAPHAIINFISYVGIP